MEGDSLSPFSTRYDTSRFHSPTEVSDLKEQERFDTSPSHSGRTGEPAVPPVSAKLSEGSLEILSREEVDHLDLVFVQPKQ